MTAIPFPKPFDPREQPVRQDDYPQTAETIARSKAFQRAERLANGLDPDTGKPEGYADAAAFLLMKRVGLPLVPRTAAEAERARDIETLYRLLLRHGYPKVADWLRDLASEGA